MITLDDRGEMEGQQFYGRYALILSLMLQLGQNPRHIFTCGGKEVSRGGGGGVFGLFVPKDLKE